jgi:hypothetical protein
MIYIVDIQFTVLNFIQAIFFAFMLLVALLIDQNHCLIFVMNLFYTIKCFILFYLLVVI